MSAQPDAVEIRVLGSLLEKQRTTPEAYPLSVNALRLACNQSTNRDPVVAYDERTVVAALERLHRRGWTRMASGAGSRARKYRHLIDRALECSEPELAVLCALMLRGSQTPGELKQRTERLHPFADLAAVEAALEVLIGRELVARLDRRPGQKEQRYVQLLGGESLDEGEGPSRNPMPQRQSIRFEGPQAVDTPSRGAGSGQELAAGGEDRVDRLERELAELRAEVADLREELNA